MVSKEISERREGLKKQEIYLLELRLKTNQAINKNRIAQAKIYPRKKNKNPRPAYSKNKIDKVNGIMNFTNKTLYARYGKKLQTLREICNYLLIKSLISIF